jgi:hypothetical protein
MRPPLLVAALCLTATRVAAAPVAVTVQDKGVTTRCAEEDNVYAAMRAPGVRRFTVEARHPAYAADLTADASAPDFQGCAITARQDFRFRPRQATLYRDARVMVRGVTYPAYWRPTSVEVEVAGRRDAGFHLIQLFQKDRGRWQEVVVLHAADGYWRLRPLPLPQFKGAVYGTSFLLGPVEESSRPYVRIRKVEVDPRARRFTVLFDKGGQPALTVAALDHQALKADVELDPPVESGRPFLAVRSMWVAGDDTDSGDLRWTSPAGETRSAPAVGFGQVQALAVGFVKAVPSRHNTSAPDLRFSGFSD